MCRKIWRNSVSYTQIIIVIIIIKQKEYKTRHDLVGKMINWELCKKFKFDNTTKWYMHKPESLLENQSHKILWDFKIQTDHLILTSWPDWVIIYKKMRTCWIVDLPSWQTTEWKSKKMKWDKYLDLARQLKRLWNLKVTVISVVISAFGKVPKGLEIGQAKIIQTAVLLRSVKILRTVSETKGGFLSFRFQG